MIDIIERLATRHLGVILVMASQLPVLVAGGITHAAPCPGLAGGARQLEGRRGKMNGSKMPTNVLWVGAPIAVIQSGISLMVIVMVMEHLLMGHHLVVHLMVGSHILLMVMAKVWKLLLVLLLLLCHVSRRCHEVLARLVILVSLVRVSLGRN